MRARDTTEEEARTLFRVRVGRQAALGRKPSDRFEPSDLEWAFAGEHEAELQRLEQQAAGLPAAEQAEREQRSRAQALREATAAVLAEWDAERHEKAQAEARKRLKKSERP